MIDNIVKNFSRRQLAVAGALCGDIIGSQYELPGKGTKDLEFNMFLPESRVTDDSVLTMAVLASLIDNVPLIDSLVEWGRRYPDAGYGRRFREWIFSDNPQPCKPGANTCTNGCAMRVSPIGAMGRTEEEVLDLAAKSAVVTHNHPDGIKGAQACALAVFMALHGYDKAEIKKHIEELTGYDLGRAYADIQSSHQFDYTCSGSVPEAIICFLESHDYESAIRNAIAMGGDADTMAAIAGSIAAAHYGQIPDNIISFCLPRIPNEMINLILRIKQLIPMKKRTDISYNFYLPVRDDSKIVDAIRYDEEAGSGFTEGLMAVWIYPEKGELFTRAGYVNHKGEIVIPPTFDRAYPFINGRASVKVGSKYGLIDKQGKYIIKPEFETTSGLCEEAGRKGFHIDYKSFWGPSFNQHSANMEYERPILPEHGIKIIKGPDGKKGIASLTTGRTLIAPVHDEIYAVTIGKSNELFSIQAVTKTIVYERDDDFARYYEDRWNTYF